jgi:predicted nucleic acid-binding protein
MLRLVIDSNVVASAFRSSLGASFALVELVRREEILSLADVDTALDALAALIEPVEAHLIWRPQLPDPNDEMVLEAAINGRADALVTYNAMHFRVAAARFGVRLARPAEILREALKS